MNIRAKRTNNPATPWQILVVSRLINLLLRWKAFESVEEAQQDFLMLTGYDSVKKMSITNARIAIPYYASLLRETIKTRKEIFQKSYGA